MEQKLQMDERDAVDNFRLVKGQLILLQDNIYERLLKTAYPSDCLALYIHYRYETKQQASNNICAPTEDIAKALKWSLTKVRRIKKLLKAIGLIGDVISWEKGRIKKNYVKVNYEFEY